jgi:hypothetical protein
MKITQRTVSLMVMFIFIFVVGSIIAARTVAYLEAGFELKGFLVEVISYIVALTGWLTLFIYSYLKGDFKDIEGPKYNLLEREEKIIESEKKAGRY